MNRNERHTACVRRAYELAQTGEYANWLSIEVELKLREGFPEARHFLDHSATRELLDSICAANQK